MPPDQAARTTVTIEVVLKVTERCNINCSYCYFFNKGNEDYRNHPAYISAETVEAVGRFLAEGAKDLSAGLVIIDFHGGEPLLLKPTRFAAMCARLTELISPVCPVRLNVQTNATVISDKWIDVFARYSVGVGVSLDGPAAYHDLYRVDHKGKGTYEATLAGIRLLRSAADAGLIREPGALCVVSPSIPAREVYRHFVDDLGFRSMDFLLPIESHDTFDSSTLEDYKRFLLELFAEWSADDNPAINLRLLDRLARILTHGTAGQQRYVAAIRGAYHIVVINSDGGLGLDDEFLPLNIRIPGSPSIWSHTLEGFLGLSEVDELRQTRLRVPDDCVDCCWQAICVGGGLHGRMIQQHRSGRGFNNRSILCEPLQELYAEVAAYLVRSNVPFERVTEALLPEHLTREWPDPKKLKSRVIPLAVGR